ncbi:twin-arginine translocase subunit TatC [Corynebacterium sp. HS2168-gen11]|uniref:twin-arginine translocase subunit TatC n=1 Tax=Corynebacterium sp. HS2168-gen11 TaxID=2974027 RepID=UPI00216AD83A|nr:twin-arginine translocase subunit TatC [Corynebacterium sp. HS2168-gen11]MCS4535076.1 twin-arginine translocase subunit TatC [Corynebacterium sp. HS2168-gen11]
MTLVEHLKELRRRVIISVIWLVIATIIGFIWYQTELFGLKSLGEILRGPYCELPPDKRAVLTLDGECRLIATTPFDMLLLRLKVGALAGTVLASPVWLYQIWGFITPGLKANERKWTVAFVFTAVFLFVLGAVLAYVVVAYGLEFLLTIGGEAQVATLSGAQYFNFILGLLVIFGVSFEVPLVIMMLNVVEILTYDYIKDKRRIIILIMFIFAAVMTPGQDPFSMLALALSLTVLMEIAAQFCRINDKRRNISRPAWMDLDDEASTPLESTPERLEPTTSFVPTAEALDTTEARQNYFDDII